MKARLRKMKLQQDSRKITKMSYSYSVESRTGQIIIVRSSHVIVKKLYVCLPNTSVIVAIHTT